MAIETTQSLFLGSRMRAFVDGYLAGTVRSGLALEPGFDQVEERIYGQIDSIVAAQYRSVEQTLEVLENENLETLNKVLAGFDPNIDTAPVIARMKAAIDKHVVVVETLKAELDGYEGVSQFMKDFRARFGAPRGTPDGSLVRTIAGLGGVPKEIITGGRFLCRRVTLVSASSDVQGSWSSPAPLALPDKSSLYAIYLEVQKAGTSRAFKGKEVTVDANNVTVSGSGGKVVIPHADVISANLGGNATHAWVVLVHNESALQTHNGRYG